VPLLNTPENRESREASPLLYNYLPLPYLREGDKGRRLFEGRVTLIKLIIGGEGLINTLEYGVLIKLAFYSIIPQWKYEKVKHW